MKPDDGQADASVLQPLLPFSVIQLMLAICREDGLTEASPGRVTAEATLFTPAFKRFVLESCNTQLLFAEEALQLQIAHEQLYKLPAALVEDAFKARAVPPGVTVLQGDSTSCLVPFVAQTLVAALRMCDNTWCVGWSLCPVTLTAAFVCIVAVGCVREFVIPSNLPSLVLFL